MIGRQFETRAEVLLDVTSVSSGEVGLELIGMNLEHSLVPTVENLAMFWVQGKKRGRADELVDWATGVNGVMWPIAHSSVATVSDAYDRRCSWSVILAYRGTGPAAVWLARKYALTSESGAEPSKFRELCEQQMVLLDSRSETTSEGAGCIYSRWSDVSLVLTASANLDGGLFEIFRWATIVLSLAGNAAILIGSWYSTRDNLNVGLVAMGLLVSGVGSWATAWLVDNASNEQTIDLSPLSAFASGFFSKQIPEGANLSFCPKLVVHSTHSDIKRAGRHDYRGWYTAGAVGLMVVAYIGLYLGLRTSRWWVSMAILGISAVTAIARSLLVPESLFLQPTGFRPEPFLLDLSTQPTRHLEFSDDEVAHPVTISAPTISNHTLQDPVLINAQYELVFSNFRTRDIYQDFPETGYVSLLGSSLQLAYEMRERKIAPLEWEYWQSHTIDPTSVITLYSDLLSQGGVWRQPLEVAMAKPFCGSGLGSVLALVGGWHMRAVALPACKIADFSVGRDIVNKIPVLDAQMGSVTDAMRRELRKRGQMLKILWMVAKIMYAVTYGSTPEHYQGQLQEFCDGKFEVGFDRARRGEYLDSVVAAGLTCAHSG